MGVWRSHGIIVDGVKLDRRQSKTLARQVYRAALGSRRAKVAFVVAVAAAPIVPIVVFAVLVVPLVPRSLAAATGVAIGVGMGAVAAIAANHGFFYVYRREIREAMSQFGYALCPGCGYWLKGLAESTRRCPECGGAITPPSGTSEGT
ncbi:MAG: hypothetical protein ACYS0D_06775 [Planctomycetota bacterium]|jgi:hypothetical protein